MKYQGTKKYYEDMEGLNLKPHVKKGILSSIVRLGYFYMDEHGNVNCVNCTDCTDCYDCADCIDCVDCVDCSGCTGDTRCERNHECKNCTDCYECVESEDCTHCYLCVISTGCDNCKHCTDCHDCTWCEECDIMAECHYCTDCRKAGDSGYFRRENLYWNKSIRTYGNENLKREKEKAENASSCWDVLVDTPNDK